MRRSGIAFLVVLTVICVYDLPHGAALALFALGWAIEGKEEKEDE